MLTIEGSTKQVPDALSVGINGRAVKIRGKKTTRGGIRYSGTTRGIVKAGRTAEEALLGCAADYEGVALTPSERCTAEDGSRKVVLSTPYTYGKNHAKAGQVKPGTGNQKQLSLITIDKAMGDTGYLVRVTFTIENEGTENMAVKASLSATALFAGGGVPAEVDGEGPIEF